MASCRRSVLVDLCIVRVALVVFLSSPYSPAESFLVSPPWPASAATTRAASSLLSPRGTDAPTLFAYSEATTTASRGSPEAAERLSGPADRPPRGPSFDRSAFESRNPRAASARWGEFVRATAPLASDVAGLWASGRLRRDDASLARAVRATLTELGPTFVKLGQILSVREDVLGPTWASELAKLQDSVRPFEGEEARAAAARAFEEGAEGKIEDFVIEPVAAASIAQVHRAMWRRPGGGGGGGSLGTAVPVAVKVLRPGVADRVAVDLAVLLRAGDLLADWAPRLLPKSQVNWRALLRGLAEGLWMECDLSGEAQRQERFRANMDSIPGLFVPEVYASTAEVMVSEWVDGVPLRAIPAEDQRLKQAQALMRDAYCQSMFVDAFFHADCHGGNLLWVPSLDSRGEGPNDGSSGRLCILDCGLMVAIEPSAAEGLLRLSLNLAARDWTGVVNDAISLGFLPPDLSEANALKARGVARRILGPYLDVGGGARAASAYSASALFDDITAAASSLPTSLPPDMVLLGRAVIQLEGLALRAYPDYRLVDDILPVAARIALRSAPPSHSRVREERLSFISDLLFADEVTGTLSGGAGDAERKSLAIERLQTLLATARSGSSSAQVGSRETGVDQPLGSIEEDILDELLLSDAIRDLVASEAADLMDSLIRDAFWRGTDGFMEAFPFPRLPNPLNLPEPPGAFESLAPRLSEEEKLFLLRLPKIFAGPSTASQPGPPEVNAMPALFLNDVMLTKVSEIPYLRRGIRILAERALIQRDTKAQAMVDSMAARLRQLLQTRLKRTGFPADIADRIASSTFQTPW